MEQILEVALTILAIFMLGGLISLGLVAWGSWFAVEFKEESKWKFNIIALVTGLVAYFIFI